MGDVNLLDLPGAPEGPGSPVCSAKGCRAAAVWVLAWNNPKIHTPERRKTWLACEEHREHLSKFLGVRGFLKDVVALEEWHEPQEGQQPQEPNQRPAAERRSAADG
jgi:hypothetical protein